MHQSCGGIPEPERPCLHAGGGYYIQPQTAAKRTDAKQVGPVRHSKDPIEVIFASNGSKTGCRFLCVRALCLGNDLGLRHPMGQEVVMAYAAFGIVRIATASQGDHQGCKTFAIQGERVFKTSAEHRRGAAIVFRCAEDRDGVGGACLIVGGIEVNLPIDPQKPSRDSDHSGRQHDAQDAPAGGLPLRVGGVSEFHAVFLKENRTRNPVSSASFCVVDRMGPAQRWRVNAISWVGMAPSRRISQGPSRDKSTMVVATLRPVAPPSTISGMRSPI